MKIALRIAMGVILLAVLISVGRWIFLDAIVQRTLEKRGSKSMGVNVELSHAELAVLDGEVMLAGLKVSSPEGYQSPLFEMTGARTAVRPATLLKEEVVVDSLVIDSPSLNIEHSLNGTNLAKVLSRIEKPASEKEATHEQKSYRIKTLEINGGRVSISSSLTAKPPVVVTLPDIRMENISSSDGAGLTLAQVFEKVFIKMTSTAFRTGKAEIPADMLLNVSADLTQFSPDLAIGLPEKTKGILEKAQGILKDLFKGEQKLPQ